MKNKSTFLILAVIFTVLPIYSQTFSVQKNQVTEWSYTSSKTYKNPFRDIVLDMIVTSPQGTKQKIPAFWAGDNDWSFRFSAPETGTYSFETICNDIKNNDLHQQKGKIKVIEYTGDNPLYKNGPLKISENNRQFEYADGTPFFWLADQWWHGMTTRFKWPEDFQTLTADRKEKGFSVIGFAVAFPCDIEPFDPRGENEAGNPWFDSSFTSINPAYFDLTDLRINHLLSQGIVPNIMGSWGYYIKWAGEENMKAHYRYLIARYAAYPITWTLAGEVTLAYYTDLGENWDFYKAQFRDQWSEVGRYLQANDPYNRLVTVHPGPGIWDGKPPLDDMSVLDFIFLQSGHNNFKTLSRAVSQVNENLELYPGKPVLHGEVCFEGMKGSSWNDIQRFLFWSNLLSGTAGFSYGVEGIWQFNTEEELFGASPVGNVWGNIPWEEAMHYKGSAEVGIGKKLMENFEYWRFEPHPEWIEANNSGELSSYFVAGIPGEVRVIYLHEKPSRYNPYTLVGLTQKSAYAYQYLDPITGKEHERITFKADDEGRWEVPEPPVMQDFVLAIYPLP